MRTLLSLSLLAPLPALAAGNAIVLVEGQVAQYRTAADAAKRSLDGAEEVDPSQPGASQRIGEAAVVLAVGQKALSVARQSGTDKPIVFCMVLGLSRSSLSRNVTGVPLEADPKLVLAGIREILPRSKRVGVIFNPRSSELLMDEAHKAAKALGLTLVNKDVSSGAGVKDAVAAIADSIDVLWLVPDPQLFSRELFTYLLSFSAERKLPLIGFLDSSTQAGALASVSPDYSAIGGTAGRLVADILGRSGSPRLPVPGLVFAPGRLTLNLQTARALGIALSDKAIAEAAQVYR